MGGRTKLSDTATEADWSFLEDPEIYLALVKTSRRVAEMVPDTEATDLFQEACLFLSVRPEKVKKDLAKGGPNYLAYCAYGVMLDRASVTTHYYTKNQPPRTYPRVRP